MSAGEGSGDGEGEGSGSGAGSGGSGGEGKGGSGGSGSDMPNLGASGERASGNAEGLDLVRSQQPRNAPERAPES